MSRKRVGIPIKHGHGPPDRGYTRCRARAGGGAECPSSLGRPPTARTTGGPHKRAAAEGRYVVVLGLSWEKALRVGEDYLVQLIDQELLLQDDLLQELLLQDDLLQELLLQDDLLQDDLLQELLLQDDLL